MITSLTTSSPCRHTDTLFSSVQAGMARTLESDAYKLSRKLLAYGSFLSHKVASEAEHSEVDIACTLCNAVKMSW